ncbi:hypothetical protein JVW08_20300, partial [Vibrio cholerae O1]|uniref:hypothetical protein n=1 Tax=Vibrio cholerae TaxID=666 RepID=UPI001C116224
FAPYGQPQLSLAPVSIGNMDAVDVVRGGGAVRYGPQNVGPTPAPPTSSSIPVRATWSAASSSRPKAR